MTGERIKILDRSKEKGTLSRPPSLYGDRQWPPFFALPSQPCETVFLAAFFGFAAVFFAVCA